MHRSAHTAFSLTVLLLEITAMTGCLHSGLLTPPPKAEPRVSSDQSEASEAADPWQWLENADGPGVRDWVNTQDTWTRKSLEALPDSERFTRRLLELAEYDDEMPPSEALDGTRQFIWKRKAGQEKWVMWVRDSETAPERILLDPNTLGEHITIDGAVPSPDGRYLAYGLMTGGDENARLRVLDVDTGCDLPDACRGTRQDSPEWQRDSSGFFYSCNPAPGEVAQGDEIFYQRICYHALGTPASEDSVVFSSDDRKELFHGVDVSEDGRWVLFGRYLGDDCELFIRRNEWDAPLQPITTGWGSSNNAWVIDDRLYILTDRGAPNGQVFVTDADRPEREHWELFIPESQDKLKWLQFVQGCMFGHYMHNAHSRIVQFTPDGRVMRELPFPELSSASVWGHWSKPPVWCGYSSFTQPFETARFDPSNGIMTTVWKTPVPIDTSSFHCEQVWVESQDGTRVSMFLMHREGIVRDGTHPAILSGYGGFDVPMTPAFSTADAVVLENGGVVAVPNIRGGGEYGRDWHMAATREGKQRSFDDFIAAAEWLVREGYTSPAHLAISGGSNGGLLVGTVLVQRPDLFRAVLCDVPLLDMVNYTRFGIADIWIPEYGDPSIESDRIFIERYSPYQNVRAGTDYPAVLFTAAENDARVSPVHAWKMTARLQWEGQGGPFLLRMLRNQGHLGAAQMTDGIREYAQALAFVFRYVGKGK